MLSAFYTIDATTAVNNVQFQTFYFNRFGCLFPAVGEWSVFVLKVLSELSLVLLVQDDDHTKEKEERTRQKKEMEKTGENAAEGREDGKLSGQILSLLSKSLLLRLVCLPRPILHQFSAHTGSASLSIKKVLLNSR